MDGDACVPPGSLVKGKLLAVNFAKSSSTSDGVIEAIGRDYVMATTLLARYADIIVVNVSCPNAPGYRELQESEPLTKILTGVVNAATSISRKSKPAIVVKVRKMSLFAITATSFSSVCVAYGIIFGVSMARRRFAAMSAISPTPRQNLFVNIGYRVMEHFKTMSATMTAAAKPTDMLLTFGTIKQVFTTRKATCVLSVKKTKDPLRISTNISRNIRERLLMHAHSQDVTQNSCTHTSFSNIVSITHILTVVLVSITSTQLWKATDTK